MLALVLSTVLASTPVPATTQAVHDPLNGALMVAQATQAVAGDQTEDDTTKDTAGQQGETQDSGQQQQQQTPAD